MGIATGLVHIFFGIPVYGIRSAGIAAITILLAIAIIMEPRCHVPPFLLPYKAVFIEVIEYDDTSSYAPPDLECQSVNSDEIYDYTEPPPSLPPPSYEEALTRDWDHKNPNPDGHDRRPS
jgi:hypothetical protein